MSAYETLYRAIDSSLCIAGIILNCILIYCIATKSPKAIATYSFLLMNLAVSDLVTIIVTLFVEPRIITEGDNIYYIANGFCSAFGHKACYIGYGLMVNLYGHLTVSQLASFVYRWYILYWKMPSKWTMSMVILVVWIPTVSFILATLAYILDNINETHKEEIATIHPELDVSQLTTFGAPHAMTVIQAKYPTLFVTMPIVPITITVLILRRSILRKIEQHIFSKQIRRMHQSLLKALTLQAFLPPMYLIGIVIWVTDVQTQLHHPLLEYGLYFMCGLIPILAPLFPLYFVAPYWNYLTGAIFNKYRVEPADSSKNASKKKTTTVTITLPVMN